MRKTVEDEQLFELADQLSETKIIGATVHRIATGWWKEGFDAGRKFQSEQKQADDFLGHFATFALGVMLTMAVWAFWG